MYFEPYARRVAAPAPRKSRSISRPAALAAALSLCLPLISNQVASAKAAVRKKPAKAAGVKKKPSTTPTAVAPIAIAPVAPIANSPWAGSFSGGEAHNLLLRRSDVPMGTNNGLRFWLRGDGSGSSVRVRLMALEPTATDEAALLRPTWVSDSVKVNFTGWREILLPRDKFTLRRVGSETVGLDLNLPADAQGPVSTRPVTVPAFAQVNALAVEATVPSKSSLVIDDVTWVTVSDAGAVTSGDSVDDFEKGNVAAWTSLGTPAQQATVTFGLATAPAMVHGGRVAFKMDVLSPAARRNTVLFPSANKAMAAVGSNTLVFTPASLFDPVYPWSLPEPGGTSSGITLQVCPEQVQAASFCVYTRQAMKDVTVQMADDLEGVGKTIPKDALDVRVVKVWKQQGTGALRNPDEASLVPELLVKDDRVPLTGVAPDVRLTGAPQTSIPMDTAKQFWVTLTTPKNAQPGHYTGRLLVTAAGSSTPITVPVDVDVLPLRLLSAAKQYAIDLRSRLDPAPAMPSDTGDDSVTDFVSKDTLASQLTDIVSHGFHYVSVHDSAATLPDALQAYQAAGVLGPYVYKGPSAADAVETERKNSHAPEFVYFADPTDSCSVHLAALTKAGLGGMTYVTSQSDYDALQDKLALVVYDRDSEYPQELLRTHGARKSNKHDWWYWDASNEDPHANRLSAGYLLWRANLYGAYVPEYQFATGADPYDDTSAGAPPALAPYRPRMLTYPVQGGVLDTLQWEALREGVNDVRYLTTFYAALRECKDAHVAKPLIDEAEGYVKTYLDKPLALLPDSEYDSARTQIAKYSLQLRTAVDAYNKKNKIQ
ncbi:hypothetical protein CCAX7_49670 [Capsulimonas corticalis]|uniref:Glycoside hydrolase 123 N-terminal domain-containing protein n=1 Tax=Capsulimonas corticalis TaxID=2219043 RepID=A0A9N7QDL1_9BACT|nr:DUF4091 domain-containing protein [Capsulimonas corticalis]BDI32916.1 hypothetical protein CCAX7_49670 [Capsulimonas corticalis]